MEIPPRLFLALREGAQRALRRQHAPHLHASGFTSRRLGGVLLRAAVFFICSSLQAITYEQWAVTVFGSVDHVDAAPSLDPDLDTLTNLEEYAFMRDPYVAEARPEAGGILLHSDGKHYLFLDFPQRAAATDLTYEVRGRADVASLCVGNVPFVSENGVTVKSPGLISVDNTTTPRTLTVVDPTAPLELGSSRGFIQLFVAQTTVPETLAFVTVGDAGKGGVAHAFDLGEFEITNAQYVEFLNAVASADEDGKAYSTLMETRAQGGIQRRGKPGTYTYEVRPNMADKPVTFVTFWAACRYCNWLHNGRPLRCRTMSAFTTEDGAYDLTHADTEKGSLVVRKPGAKFFLPSDEEWVKAAFYDAGNDRFWNYATQSDALPTEAMVDAAGKIINDNPNIANYNRSALWDSDSNAVLEANVSTVGSGGPGSRSPYGAFDMAGNVAEWTDTAVLEWGRIQRGGSWNHLVPQMNRNYRFPFTTYHSAVQDTGFRVARPRP